jgi:hypothetical protein
VLLVTHHLHRLPPCAEHIRQQARRCGTPLFLVPVMSCCDAHSQ